MAHKKYPKYKDSGIPWLGQIPEHWKCWKLSRGVKNIGSGTTPSSSNKNFYENGTINWLNSGDFNDNLIFECKKKVTQKALDEYSALKIFPKGTLSVAMYGATIGKVCLIQFSTTTNQACCNIPQGDTFFNKFLMYWFIGNKRQIINLSYGGGQPNISQDVIKSLRIPIPEFSEQTAIANFLDYKTEKIDRFITKKKQLIELLHEQKSAIINQAVTKGLDPNVKMKDSGIEWLGNIPEHWGVVRVKYLGNAIIGLTYSPTEIVGKNEGTLVLRSSNVQDGKIVYDDCVYVSTEVPKKKRTKKGDILICSRNGSIKLVGKNALIDEKASNETFGAFMTVFRSENFEYLHYFFNCASFKAQSSLFTTSTINQLTTGILNNIIISIPETIEEQQQIVNYIEKESKRIDKTIATIEKEIALVQEYKTALIAEAVTGKINVSNNYE